MSNRNNSFAIVQGHQMTHAKVVVLVFKGFFAYKMFTVFGVVTAKYSF